jgi:hypothetical protein
MWRTNIDPLIEVENTNRAIRQRRRVSGALRACFPDLKAARQLLARPKPDLKQSP